MEFCQNWAPFSLQHHYTNYIKASPNSLFRDESSSDKYKNYKKECPSTIYDYYRSNKLVEINGKVPNPSAWNLDLNAINSRLGNIKQVNMIIVLVFDLPIDFYYSLKKE